MRAESFLGQVVAVISRRTQAFIPISGEPSTFPGLISSKIRHHEVSVLPISAEDVKIPDASTATANDKAETRSTSPEVRWSKTPRISRVVRDPESEPLLTPAQVATMFRVDPKTVARWAKAGRLTPIRTLGGHRRYRETEVRAMLEEIERTRAE
jgi:excisionase family DNA binding protein